MSLEYVFAIMVITSVTVIIALAVVLSMKSDKINLLSTDVANLKKSLDEMDEQAKLIVRTDVELNKTQEELDKKITGLYSLQRLSRAVSTTLVENQIFQRIEQSYLEDLGFEKACAFLWNERERRFALQLAVGFPEEEAKNIRASIESNKEMYVEIMRSEKSISSGSTFENSGTADKINRLFNTVYFVISPILPKEGNKGFLFVGTADTEVLITEGDEELITILTNQIGQSLENARLFENTWKAQQELEHKVEERTRALSQALEEVKIASKRKTDFISSVSHELRTPLTSIKGYAKILADEKLGALPPPVKERLEKINVHSDELVHIVNDLLDIARIESGKAVMKLEEQNLGRMITDVVDLIMIQCKNKNIELAIKMPQDIPPIFADRSQIERVLINLLGNAVKFTPANGKIFLTARSFNNSVQVDITDTGIGIPQESLPKLFQEFYRVDTAVKGTGLGLSLVKHIVEAHQGRVWVESALGKGSTFSFMLPLK